MKLQGAFFAIGVAAVTSGHVLVVDAHAQESRTERSAAAAEVPWYERFTFSPGSPGNPGVVASTGADRASGFAQNPRAPGPAATATSNWGMTFNVDEADRVVGPLAVEARREAQVGAFFRFSPRITVGGRVSVAQPKSEPGAPRADRDEPQAGVKLESAFRF